MNTARQQRYRLGRRPGNQSPRPQPSNRGWVEKLDTGTSEEDGRMKIARNILTVGTWNVRTLHAAGKLELLKDEMKNYRWDILGLSEMRWTGAGEIGGGEVIWSGHETKHEAGVGFLLNHQAKRALLGYNPISSRLMAARFSATPFNITVIQAYAPTADSSEEDVEQFYEDLEKTLEEVPKRDIKVLMGDWNAKIGTDEKGWETVMGRYGHGDRNDSWNSRNSTTY